MKRGGKIVLGVVGAFALMQLGQCRRTNPPVTAEIDAPADVKAVLHRACWDCHSNQTRWPWYARVAPVSWLLHDDVVDGRRHLNFTEWDKLSPERRTRKIGEAWEQVKEGEMPPWFYLPLHPPAKLSDADKAILEKWAAGAGH